MHKNNCKVCGLTLSFAPWGEDGETPTWQICPCCGTEFGYEDCNKDSVIRKRNEWLADGCNWFDKSKKPENWSFDTQKINILQQENERTNR